MLGRCKRGEGFCRVAACHRCYGHRSRAVHIDHGLQASTGDLKAAALALCASLNVPCTMVSLNLAPGPNVEARARTARYAAFAEKLVEGAYLLTAHHQNDQAETLLMQLFRGSGCRGLAAMPACKPLGKGFHLRPLLEVPAEAMLQYAQEHALVWYEDPMNDDRRFERTWVRQVVVPTLKERTPQVVNCLARSARLLQATLKLIQP